MAAAPTPSWHIGSTAKQNFSKTDVANPVAQKAGGVTPKHLALPREFLGYYQLMEERFLATYYDVAQAVQSGRQTLGLSQNELANLAGVGSEFIIDLEAGHPRAEIANVLKVLKALKIHALALPPLPPSKVRMEDVDLAKVVARFA